MDFGVFMCARLLGMGMGEVGIEGGESGKCSGAFQRDEWVRWLFCF